jgi:hypothetical protein
MSIEERREMYHELARRLCIAWISSRQGVTMATIDRKVPRDPAQLADYWYALAEQVDRVASEQLLAGTSEEQSKPAHRVN